MDRKPLTPAARKARSHLVISRVAFGVSLAASVAGNILASGRNPFAIGLAIWIVASFLLTMLMFEKTPNRKGALNWAKRCGIAAIAGIAGWASYWHLHEVCVRAGADTLTSYLLPLTVDVVIAFASPGIYRKPAPATPASRRKPQAKSVPDRKLKAV